MKLEPGELGATLFELSPCAVVVVDRDYNIIVANAAFRENYGQWEGSHCYEVFKRQHRPCSRCAALDTFRDGQVHVTEEHGVDKEGRHINFEVKTAPLFDAAGKVEHVLEMTVDISRFRDMESRYHLLFERVPCYITVLDRQYRIVEANWRHRETFGDANRLCYQVYMQSAQPCGDCPVRRTFEDGRVHTQQKEVMGKKGERIHFIVHSAPLYDRSGNIETVIEMATDITPMVEMQGKLLVAEGDAAMEKAVEVVTTTLQQLLSGFDELASLRDSLERDGAGRQALQGLQSRIDHLTAMLAVMTRYGQRRQLARSAQPTSPKALVAEVVRLTTDRPSSSTIRIRGEVEDGLPAVKGDAEALRDCLACLVHDFTELCPPSRQGTDHVLLHAASCPEGVLVEISLRGLGLVTAAAELPASRSQGVSMSLLVVRKTLEAFGGTVGFFSSHGHGITFRVVLPAF